MAKRIFLSDIDLAKNQLLNVKLQNLAVHPAGVTTSADEGFTYYNTADDTVYVWTWDTATSTGAWKDLGNTGALTSVSVVSANGLAGTSSGGATPALTLSTTVSGVLKGNGTAISAATSGTDYSAGTGALGTGIIKSTTGTGALTIAVAGDFPTLNQNTTGTSSNITGVVAIANGGTGQATATAGFNALSPMTTGGDIIYGGASGTGTRLANGSAGQMLQSNGTTSAPTWVTPVAGTVKKYAATLITDGVVTTVSITAATHGLGTSGDFIVQLKEIATNIQVEAEYITVPSTGVVTVNFNVAPATGVYRIVILG